MVFFGPVAELELFEVGANNDDDCSGEDDEGRGMLLVLAILYMK